MRTTGIAMAGPNIVARWLSEAEPVDELDPTAGATMGLVMTTFDDLAP